MAKLYHMSATKFLVAHHFDPSSLPAVGECPLHEVHQLALVRSHERPITVVNGDQVMSYIGGKVELVKG